MIKLDGNKAIGSAFDFIDKKLNGAITKLHKHPYIGNLEDYLLNGYISIRDPSKYLQPLIKLDKQVRFSSGPKRFMFNYDASVGYPVPNHIYQEIKNGIYSKSVILKHLNVVKTDSDRVTVAYNNVQNLRWPGEPVTPDRAPDREAEYIEVNTNVALLVFTISAKRNQVRSRSIEDEYIESNVETLVEYFDRNIIYGEDAAGKISGLYPRPSDQTIVPDYSYVHEIQSFDGDYLIVLKNDLPVKYRKDASWIMNSDTGRLLADRMKLEVEHDLPATILGIPVIYNDYMDSVDTKDGAPVIIVNLHKAYTFTQGIIGKAPSVRRFEEDIRSEKEELMALTRYRIGGKLTNPDALRVLRVKNQKGLIRDNQTSLNRIYSNVNDLQLS